MICHLVWMKYKVLIFFVSVSIRQAIDCRRSELVTYISCCCLLAYRSSHPEVFCKKGILRNFAKFTGKNLSQSLFFNKVAGLRPATLFKKETLAQLFSCEFCKFLQNTSGRLFLYDSLVLRSFRLCFSIGFPDVFLLCSVL